MISWGDSWGDSWGTSWGTDSPPAPVVAEAPPILGGWADIVRVPTDEERRRQWAVRLGLEPQAATIVAQVAAKQVEKLSSDAEELSVALRRAEIEPEERHVMALADLRNALIDAEIGEG